jgi:hypothetical protein
MNIIKYGNGWYDLEEKIQENSIKNYWRWGSDKSELYLDLNDDIESISFRVSSHIIDRKIVIKNNGDIIYKIFIKKDAEVTLYIPNKKLDKITILTDTVNLYKLNINKDVRDLGLSFSGITLNKMDNSEEIVGVENWMPIENIDVFFPNHRYYLDASVNKNKKIGILLYVDKYYPELFNNLNKYKISRNNIEFIIYSDNPNIKEVPIKLIDKIGDFSGTRFDKKTKYGYWSFVKGIQIAKELNWDYFFYLEWDCRIGKDYWFDIALDEFYRWNEEPIVSGTPMIQYPYLSAINCGNDMTMLFDYINQYFNKSKIHFGIDLWSSDTLFTINGALGFYKVDKMVEYFDEWLKNYNSKSDQSIEPYDLYIGKRLWNEFKMNSLKYTGWIPSIFSTGQIRSYNHQQLKKLLETEMKIAVHPIKENAM